MAFESICSPALIYIIFSLTQISIDTYNGMYNTAFLKTWVAILFTILLNYLCSIGLGVISWFIVFIPFILMTLIISILLIVFGLDPETGKSLVKVHNDSKTRNQNKPIDYRLESARESSNLINNSQQTTTQVTPAQTELPKTNKKSSITPSTVSNTTSNTSTTNSSSSNSKTNTNINNTSTGFFDNYNDSNVNKIIHEIF